MSNRIVVVILKVKFFSESLNEVFSMDEVCVISLDEVCVISFEFPQNQIDHAYPPPFLKPSCYFIKVKLK